MADFVMVASLLSVFFVALVQVGMTLYVRNTLISCASEGARLGARADASPAQGVARTRELVTSTLSSRFAQQVSSQVVMADGARTLAVRVVAPLPVIGLLGVGQRFEVVGRAFLERQ